MLADDCMGHPSFQGFSLTLAVADAGEARLRFDALASGGEIVVTVSMKAVPCGTELTILQENLPDAIPAAQCYLGWQESLRNLARLVEPDIRG